MYEDEIPIGRAIDIRGKQYGKLTVLYRVANNGKKTRWKCQCECGNIVEVDGNNLTSGNNTSCGCQKGKHIKDITGQQFGRLTVIKPTQQKNHKWLWLCQCGCGNMIETFSDYLLQGDKQSCGCLQQENRHNNAAQLQGQRFGRLIVQKEAYRKNYTVFWECTCDCGNIIITTSGHLLSGHTQSCGCLKSKGEEKISQLLKENNIPFIKEMTFSDCYLINSHPLRFDFYVNNSYLIEFDGMQHFYKSGFDDEATFEKRQQYDLFKTQWCFNNNIPLIRIPYTALDNLNLSDLLLESSQYRLIKEELNDS